MIFEEDVEFLKHHGVKGMKWGVRKQRRQNETRGQRINRYHRNAVRVVSVALIASVGAQMVGRTMSRHGSTPIGDLRATKGVKIGWDYDVKAPKPTVTGLRYSNPSQRVFNMGPIGSTSVSRLNGAIPMPRVRG